MSFLPRFTFIVRKSSGGTLNFLAFVEIFTPRAWLAIFAVLGAGAVAFYAGRRAQETRCYLNLIIFL